MGDLEDAFLKKNVPGRYSSWTDNNDDKRIEDDNDNVSNDDSEDDDYYFQGLPSKPPPLSPASYQQQRPSGNTGVKGVLADYREAQQHEQLRKEEERLDRMKVLHRATHPAVSDRIASSNDDNKSKMIDNNDDDDSDLDDGSDDEFLKQFRNQPTPPTFGSMTSASPEEYVQLVDTIDPHSYLIVHLYESSIQQCRMLHSSLERVAQCMDYAKFVQVNALEANPNLDTICLPALLIYQGGVLVHNLVRFTDGLPSGRGFGVEEVREVLERTLGVVDTGGVVGR
ncbi:hypothetical protein ACHAXR_006185 [Thalassiosira sp. AJA248-18]